MAVAYISGITPLRPKHETSQEEAFEWLAASHAKAESSRGGTASFRDEIRDKLRIVGCKPHQIAKRGHEIGDFLHHDWKNMEIYRLEEHPQGAPLSTRQRMHASIVEQKFETFYQDAPIPAEILHVSCTGYASPSGAQKIIAQKGALSHATHLYHMGCSAAMPAIRTASAFAHTTKSPVDVVHTEVCTLHYNPLNHSPEQLVAQTLFADGFIKYTVSNTPTKAPHFKILAMHEEIVPDSLQAMTWTLSEFNFNMILAKEIPKLVASRLPTYLKTLCSKGNTTPNALKKSTAFAIHPGGPKILQYAQELLDLEDQQIQNSREILRDFGNMSSATLPHIWHIMLGDDTVPEGAVIASLAFGPGLTIAGALLQKKGS